MMLMTVLLIASLEAPHAEPKGNYNLLKHLQSLYLLASGDASDGRPPDMSRVGGGGRNPCLDVPIALVPGEDTISIGDDTCQTISLADIAMTYEIEPTVWVYIPEYIDTDLTAKLTLIQNRRALEQWTLVLPDSSGVICLQLPYQLEIEQLYEWEFAVQLTSSPADNPKVGGLIQYTEEEGNYWADNLTDLAQQRIEQPEEQDLISEWNQLLVQQGLGAISQAPLMNSCLPLEAM